MTMNNSASQTTPTLATSSTGEDKNMPQATANLNALQFNPRSSQAALASIETMGQLRRMFNLTLCDPSASEFLAASPQKGFHCVETTVTVKPGRNVSMFYETEQGETRNALIFFDEGCVDRVPTFATYHDNTPAIAIGTQYLQECSAEELKVRIAVELGYISANKYFSPITTTHNNRKVQTYSQAVNAFYAPKESDLTHDASDSATLAASRSAKINYLRAVFFCLLRGGLREVTLEADRLAVRYCGTEQVARYLAAQISKENDVDRLETINRIKAITDYSCFMKVDQKPLVLGLAGKSFIGIRAMSARYGDGYEVSSKGDKRFSAMYAKMPDGRTLEAHYQCCVKGYDPGGTDWKKGKGRPPLDTTKDLFKEYVELWRTWVKHNPSTFAELIEILPKHNYLLTDCFATTPVNQAAALAKLCNEYYAFKEVKQQRE